MSPQYTLSITNNEHFQPTPESGRRAWGRQIEAVNLGPAGRDKLRRLITMLH